MTFYDFTAYKCTAHDFRPDDFTTYVLRPLKTSVYPLYFSQTQSKDGLYSSYDEPYPSYDDEKNVFTALF